MGGKSLIEISKEYLGKPIYYIMRAVIIFLLILVVAVFTSSPAALLTRLTSDSLSSNFWMIIIIAYYLVAAILPVDKLIAKLYPVFGLLLSVMALGILGGILCGDKAMPEMTLANLHPDKLPVWPFMCITVACGAISGFHATQSPLVAKCITSERQSKKIFYGAMLSESVIALIWAAAGVTFYGATSILNDALSSAGQAGVVYEISRALLGTFGSVLAIAGIVICPISTGDTALRAARLMLSETLHIPQKSLLSRVLLTIPLLALSMVITQLDFSIVWRYFAWANQVLAMFFLWVSSAYLIKHSKYRLGSLITALPASFMSSVCITYIMAAPEGFRLSTSISYPIGLALALALFTLYLIKLRKHLAETKLHTTA